jgi:hypothetical protein
VQDAGRKKDCPQQFVGQGVMLIFLQRPAKNIVKNLISFHDSFYDRLRALMIKEATHRKKQTKIIGRVKNASLIKMKPHHQCS